MQHLGGTTFAVIWKGPGISSGPRCCMKAGACTPAGLLSTAKQKAHCQDVAVPVSLHPAGPPVAGCHESPAPCPAVPVHVHANACICCSCSCLLPAPSDIASPCSDSSVHACRPHLDPEPASSAAPRPAVEAEALTAGPGSSTGMLWTDDLQASDLPLPASALRQVATGDAGMARGAGGGKQARGGGLQQQAGTQMQEPLPGAALSCG